MCTLLFFYFALKNKIKEKHPMITLNLPDKIKKMRKNSFSQILLKYLLQI